MLPGRAKPLSSRCLGLADVGTRRGGEHVLPLPSWAEVAGREEPMGCVKPTGPTVLS